MSGKVWEAGPFHYNQNELMKKSLPLPTVISNLLLAIGLVFAWVFLAPTKIGGGASYVMVQGHSMEPKFQSGDLALVRKASSYQIGDIVTYWDESMAAYTIHRIIDIKQDRYVLQGDNNSWIDPVYPSQEEIIGKLWIHIPRLGKAVEWLRSPANFALVMGLSGGLLMTGMVLSPKKNRKKDSVNLNPNGIMAIGLYLLGLLFFAFLALSFYAFSRPVSINANDLLYQQEGRFSYSATATPGIYDSNTVQPGEPIFPKLTCTLNVDFSYNLIGSQVQGISGSHQFYARVLDAQSGWSRTIPMSRMLDFNGTSFSNTGTIDLCQIEALVATLEQETGLRSSTYTMEVVSAVSIMGALAGETISDSFTPILAFKFDEAHFYLDSHDSVEDVLNASKPRMSTGTTSQANILPLFGLKPSVRTARIAATVGIVISLIGLLSLGLYLYFTVYGNQEAIIRLKYGALLLDVYENTYEPPAPVIDVTSIDDLAKLADRHGTMILHIPREFLQDYLVQGENATYRYSISTGANRMTAQTPLQPEALGVAWNAAQSNSRNNQQSYQNLEYWGTEQTNYELDDTQPTSPVQRIPHNSTYREEPVFDEADQTMYLGKVSL